jgi:D-glycero-D-manno-heptose 1,7-bisphosphate phosphatase
MRPGCPSDPPSNWSTKLHPRIVSVSSNPRRIESGWPSESLTVGCYHDGVNSPETKASWRNIRTVFLDRDGVINVKMPEGSYVRSPAELTMLDGVAAAIARLNRAGLRVIVVSNQRGIALGLYSANDVLAIQAAIESHLAAQGAHLDAFYFCPHDKGQCNCRKPLPGLFEQAAAAFPDITAATSAMIGDSLSDIEFGRRLGMRNIFIESAAEPHRSGLEQASNLADACSNSLAEAVETLLGE